MARLNRFTRALWDLDTFFLFDDFWSAQTDLTWVDTITDTGTVVMGGEKDGVATLTPSDGTVADNDEVYLASANALFIFKDNCPLYGRARIRFTETAAGIYNAAFGFQNAVGANSIIDDGGGLKVSGSTMAIYKVDGESVWRCVTACNGVSTVTKSTLPAVGATWYDLEIHAQDLDGTNMPVVFRVDGELLRDTNGAVIRHSVPIANAAQMQVFVGAKLGAITNNDTLKCDYIYAANRRG